MPSKARDIVEKQFGRRPSDHPVINLHVHARKMKSLANAASKKCHDTETWDKLLQLAEIILGEKRSPRKD